MMSQANCSDSGERWQAVIPRLLLLPKKYIHRTPYGSKKFKQQLLTVVISWVSIRLQQQLFDSQLHGMSRLHS